MIQLRFHTVLIWLFLILCSSPAMATALLISWQENTETDLAGYKVYYGTASGQYGSPINVGKETSYRISDLESDTTYYMAVTAYDEALNESGFSQELSAYIPVADTSPPSGSIIINGGAASTTSRTVNLSLNATDSQGSVASMMISNDSLSWSQEVAYATTQAWVLSQGDGNKTVYVLFRDIAGNLMSTPVSDSIELLLDSDSDGMPDAWEITYGLDPTNPADASLDSDHDGLSNIEEYYDESNPYDPSDNAPVTNAGADQKVDPSRVCLDGTSSDDPNGDPLSYFWSEEMGPIEVDIDQQDSAQASFVAIKSGQYRFKLSCFDGKLTTTDTVNVEVNNVGPSVEAGSDITTDASQEITLHATGTDPNADELSYHWSLIEGPEVTLTGMDSQDLVLVPGNAGQYRFSVVCNDGLLNSTPDEIYVTVNAINSAPTAVAGLDRDVQLNERIVLDGSASSDPDGDELSFIWQQTSGPQVSLSDAQSAQAWFDADVQGTLEFTLTVSDEEVASTPDSISIRVLSINQAPIADAGDDIEVNVGDMLTLDAGSSYDPDDDPLSFSWSQVSGAQVNLTGGDTVTPSFTPTTSGVLVFSVRISDGQAISEDSVNVTVNNPNQVPLADAGDDFSSIVGEEVSLDGSMSYDPDGDDISYFWAQIEGPGVSLDFPNTFSPSFISTQSGVYVFELRVSDEEDTSKADTVTVTIQNQQSGIELISPLLGVETYRNPKFRWDADGFLNISLFIAINDSDFYRVYIGSQSSFSLHPVLWYWFIPSGTTISWYVEGEILGTQVKSEVFTLTKK